MNFEFAVPFGTAAGRSFARRRPATRVRKSARACLSQAAARVRIKYSGSESFLILHFSFAPERAQQPAAADFRRDILQQTRLRSSRQPAAAPGRRAASSRPIGPLVHAHRSAAGLSRVRADPLGPYGPQPPGSGGPQLASRRSASCDPSAGCSPNS